MILLVLVTALASALLDNVTTVLLVAPVTLLVCDRLNVRAAPFLMAEVFASNIGGASTLVGDPPNIIIASRAGLSFNDFLVHMLPIVVVVMAVFVLMLPRLFRGSFDVDPDRVADVMSLEEREAIRDPALLIKCAVVLVAVFAAFIAHSALHIAPSIVALLGAGVLVLITRLEKADYLSGVEWETLLFFAGLFIMVGALVKTGVIDHLARLATDATGGNALLTVMLILGVSAPVSGVIDNIPYVATMTPIVAELATSMHGEVHQNALWWALALGADFGGNLTVVGASANVVMLGIARRSDSPIGFWEFTRKGVARHGDVDFACGAVPLAALLRPQLAPRNSIPGCDQPGITTLCSVSRRCEDPGNYTQYGTRLRYCRIASTASTHPIAVSASTTIQCRACWSAPSNGARTMSR